jgi:peptide/nickel transport system permease protein
MPTLTHASVTADAARCATAVASSEPQLSVPVLLPDRQRRVRRQSPLVRFQTPLLALSVVAVAVAAAAFAPVLSPYDPLAGELGQRLQPPAWVSGSSSFILGTDQQGRDVLSRLLWGGRISLLVGAVSTSIAAVIGIGLGTVSGFYRGVLDEVIMRVADIQLSFPFLALAIAVVAVLGPGLGNVLILLSVSGWVLFARLIRGDVLTLREGEFIQAARVLGATDGRILLRHVLPNVLGAGVVVATFAFSQMVIAEASLSFLGLGVQPPTPTWGGMLNDARDYLEVAPWLATVPGVALLALVLAVNLFGDWLRDELDPRLRLE